MIFYDMKRFILYKENSEKNTNCSYKTYKKVPILIKIWH